jgi:glyoxylase-like metal-dependent hydrolase (beta-lactamase superfamily II)
VVAGDVLFRESIGRTDLPGGNMNTLLEAIKTKLFTLPDETIILSGHGEQTTIAHEKRHNPFLNEASSQFLD